MGAKRYWVFANDDYYAGPGFSDFVYETDDLEEAEDRARYEFCRGYRNKIARRYDNVSVWDTHTKENVYDIQRIGRKVGVERVGSPTIWVELPTVDKVPEGLKHENWSGD